jgi:hypothetical protein
MMKRTRPRTIDASRRAKYLVLLGPETAPRALLFNEQHLYLAEMIDDGMLVDRLKRSSRTCAPPSSLRFDAAAAAQAAAAAPVRCFLLG